MKNSGIVLKNLFPKKHKIIMLDKSLGTIGVLSETANQLQRLCNGALLEYVVQPRQSLYSVRLFDIIDVPFGWARRDILFLHHVLELSYYFLPLQSHTDGVFELLCFLYKNDEQRPFKNIFKKLFLMRFFMVLGMYPDDKLTKSAHFSYLMTAPIDVLIDHGIDLRTEQCVEEWLLRCLYMHPKAHMFKTIHFFSRNYGERQ